MNPLEAAKKLFVEGLGFLNDGDYGRAEQSLREAHRLIPDRISVVVNLSAALLRQDKIEEAKKYAELAVKLDATTAQGWMNLGSCLSREDRYTQALECFDKATALEPGYAEAWIARGVTLKALLRLDEARQSYDKAIALAPASAEAFASRAMIFALLKRYEEAVADNDRALTLKPDLPYLLGDWLGARMLICRWDGFEDACHRLRNAIDGGVRACRPLTVVSVPTSPAQQKKCAHMYIEDFYRSIPRSHIGEQRPANTRIRLGYFSADFHNHATAVLMAGLFERHDRSRFETMAFSFGSSPKDAMRLRLEGAFDRFEDVRHSTAGEIAALARELQVDIAIDLKGFMHEARTAVFALRAAPIQVNYLGYPGTMGADYIDYVLADRTLIPEDERRHYSEKVVYLPNTYQVNDSSRRISDVTPARSAAGLPDDAFVFCCFNNNYKITPDVFDIWMQILRSVEGSVLWLLEDTPVAAANLRNEAKRRGLSAERLVFANRVAPAEHLARHRLADLFLDTLHYNAHTTASDALWAGLPVLTRLGDAFAGRVAASLLFAVGLPELVARSNEEYQALALALASDPRKLAGLRQKLARQRTTQPLFDTTRFTLDIEAAYTAMWERHLAGLAPDHIHV